MEIERHEYDPVRHPGVYECEMPSGNSFVHDDPDRELSINQLDNGCYMNLHSIKDRAHAERIIKAIEGEE